MKIGQKLIIKGKTQKGKNRIREVGNEWVVIARSNRWIRAVADQDFSIEE